MQTGAVSNRFAGLDHLRALAIIIVFVYHYSMFGHPTGLYTWLGSWGWTGVMPGRFVSKNSSTSSYPC